MLEVWKGPVMGEKWEEPEAAPIDEWEELVDDEGRKVSFHLIGWKITGRDPCEEGEVSGDVVTW